MKRDLPPFLLIGVGSLPHTDQDKAVRLVLSGFPDIPYWPQLPRRTNLENMYIQFAAGLHFLLSEAEGPYPAVKGQITGPVSFGLMITDRRKKPAFYDPVGRDVLVKHLLRIAQWQFASLSRLPCVDGD